MHYKMQRTDQMLTARVGIEPNLTKLAKCSLKSITTLKLLFFFFKLKLFSLFRKFLEFLATLNNFLVFWGGNSVRLVGQ